MSLDRSPSPRGNGGWSSPGLTTPSEDPTPTTGSNGNIDSHSIGGGGPTWASAKSSSAAGNAARSRGHPSYQSQNQGFFARHMRKISSGLPLFTTTAANGGVSSKRGEERYAEKEKLGRGRMGAGNNNAGNGGIGEVWGELLETKDWSQIPHRLNLMVSRRRKVMLVAGLLAFVLFWVYLEAFVYWYRRTSWLGGGSKFVIILGANVGGGVMEWKGAREWAIERDSVRNKKKYAAKWGYDLDIVDMSTKKRYAHEWRESWEKVDVVRNAMKKFPHAEWFWWLDLNTFIMEPSYSLQSHIFNDLNHNTYRDINVYNPLGIQHPPNGSHSDKTAKKFVNYLDPEALSLNGDGKSDSINLIVPQDCAGFNLGSFFIRRSGWTDRLLDIWWDPVFYEQRHMEWEHKEQDALEYLYTNQPWVRPHMAFISQRRVNAFPSGACGDDRGIPAHGCTKLKLGDDIGECGIQGIHYQQRERDFLVNMAGCEWGRDCWGEMYNFRQMSNKMNRSPWERFKDSADDAWQAASKPKPKVKDDKDKKKEGPGDEKKKD